MSISSILGVSRYRRPLYQTTNEIEVTELNQETQKQNSSSGRKSNPKKSISSLPSMETIASPSTIRPNLDSILVQPRNICQVTWPNNTGAILNVDTMIHLYNLGSPSFLNKDSNCAMALWLDPRPRLFTNEEEIVNRDTTNNNNSDKKEDTTQQKAFSWKRWEVRARGSANCVYLTVSFKGQYSQQLAKLMQNMSNLSEEFGHYLLYNYQDDEITFISSSVPEGYVLFAIFLDLLKERITASNVHLLFSKLPLEMRVEYYNVLLLLERKVHLKKQHFLKYAPLTVFLFQRIDRESSITVSVEAK